MAEEDCYELKSLYNYNFICIQQANTLIKILLFHHEEILQIPPTAYTVSKYKQLWQWKTWLDKQFSQEKLMYMCPLVKVNRHAELIAAWSFFGRSSTPWNICQSMQRFAHHGLRQAYKTVLYAWRSPWWANHCIDWQMFHGVLDRPKKDQAATCAHLECHKPPHWWPSSAQASHALLSSIEFPLERQTRWQWLEEWTVLRFKST